MTKDDYLYIGPAAAAPGAPAPVLAAAPCVTNDGHESSVGCFSEDLFSSENGFENKAASSTASSVRECKRSDVGLRNRKMALCERMMAFVEA